MVPPTIRPFRVMLRRMKIAKIVWLFLAFCLPAAIAQQQKIYALKAARLFDSAAARSTTRPCG